MKKRRVLSVVLAASMFAMLLTGCGGGNQGSAEGSQAAAIGQGGSGSGKLHQDWCVRYTGSGSGHCKYWF